MTGAATDLLLREYQEINAHLRANTTQFVNWFSAFLAFSLAISLFMNWYNARIALVGR